MPCFAAGLMFPGDQISDSPPAFNRPFDLYPRHGFGDAPRNYNRFCVLNAHAPAGAVHEEMPFMGEGGVSFFSST
jgi:hypothetical protein